jgi:hypothetical protein
MANPENDRDRKSEEPGEGNREADRRYRESTERFVRSGAVEPAADEARRAVDDPSQRRELEDAERAGKSHAADRQPDSKPR